MSAQTGHRLSLEDGLHRFEEFAAQDRLVVAGEQFSVFPNANQSRVEGIFQDRRDSVQRYLPSNTIAQSAGAYSSSTSRGSE